ncbi:MAG: galactofuranose ABC transporter, permease protein YjfF [Sphaerochaeta sp.]|nr:galactofuranose ABC transporter, permease protein YjfF [Sphaerochaeta sp.]
MSRKRLFQISRRDMPLVATFIVFLLLYAFGGFSYRNFMTPRVFLNLLTDNAVLGITAVGMTFVIISGGIDLSVGAVISTTAMIVAVLTKAGMNNMLVIAIALLFGTTLGFLMGGMIQYFKTPPFIVTLAGMFFARGLGYVLSLGSVPITHPFYTNASSIGIKIGNGKLSMPAMALLAMILIGWFISRRTRFGRNVFAVGGNEQSAILMGLPVTRTKIAVYTFSGFCSAVAGFIYTFYTLSGYGLAAMGLEMEAIASAVIGGTLMTGGYGTILGTLLGTLIQGLIKSIIAFNGQFSVFWIKLFTGGMLLGFILLQKIFVYGTKSRRKKR